MQVKPALISSSRAMRNRRRRNGRGYCSVIVSPSKNFFPDRHIYKVALMKIHDITGFPNPARIRIVLAEKGLDSEVEFVRVKLYDAEHQKRSIPRGESDLDSSLS
jgi:hypothetical protein